MPSAASSYAPLLGLGCQGLLVPGGHALNHRHKEAWPEQGSSRRGHVCKNRAKNALTGSRSCAFACRGTRAHFRLCRSVRIELRAFLRVRAASSLSQKQGEAWSLLGDSYNKPRPATAAESKTRPAKPKQ